MTDQTPPPPTGPQHQHDPPYPPNYGSPPPPRRRPAWFLPLTIGGGLVVALLLLAAGAALLTVVDDEDTSVTGVTAPTTTKTPPTSPPPITAAPTAPRGATPVEFGVQGTISEDGQPVATMTVAAPETAQSLLGGIHTPDHGSAFVTFKVTITNTSTATRRYNMFDFYVRSPVGERYRPTFGREPALSSGTLNPGETVSGWLTFDAGEHGTLAYTTSAFGAGAAIAEWAF